MPQKTDWDHNEIAESFLLVVGGDWEGGGMGIFQGASVSSP